MVTRRTLVLGTALAPLFAERWTQAALAQAAGASFMPAAVPYRLTRTVERQLGRVGKLVVARSWRVSFVSSGRGFRVDGDQTKVTVDAPPVLADLARIERERVETGMFPLALDASGTMVGTAAAHTDEALADAVEQIRGRLASRTVAAGDRVRADQFMESLQAAGYSALASWPSDLFAPAIAAHTTSREVQLPDGTVGALTITTSAARDPVTGVMQRFERRIDTMVKAQSKTGAERFELTTEL